MAQHPTNNTLETDATEHLRLHDEVLAPVHNKLEAAVLVATAGQALRRAASGAAFEAFSPAQASDITGLDGRLDTVEAELPNKATTVALTTEATNRADADTALDGRLDSVETTLPNKADLTDARFTDQRVPTDGSVTNTKVATNAAIAESKLALASDAAAGTASRRTLGTGATQAAAGNDTRIVGAQQVSEKDQANGYPGLNASGFIVPARLGADPTAAKVLHGDGTWALVSTGADPNEPVLRAFQDNLLEYAFANHSGLSLSNPTGCAVTPSSPPAMSVDVAAGEVHIGQSPIAVTSGTLLISAANASLARRDLIVVDAAGVKSVVTGTPANVPTFPAYSGVVLASVYVSPLTQGTIQINAVDITDHRVSVPYFTLPNSGAAKRMLRVNATANGLEYIDPMSCVIADTRTDGSAVNTTNETTVADLTLPGGFVGIGDVVRFVVRADSLNNSGAAVNYTYRVKIGATTLTAPSYSASSFGTRRKAYIVVDIHITGASEQKVGVSITGGGAGSTEITALAAAQSFAGTATTTENLATDKQIQFTVQMGTAATNVDFFARSSTLELIRRR